MVQVLNPIEWRVPLSGSVSGISELPADLRDLAFAVRFALGDLVPIDSFQSTRLRNQNLAEPELVEEVLAGLRAADAVGEEQIITRTVVAEDGTEQKFETVLLPLSTESRQVEWNQISVDVAVSSQSGLATRLEIERASPIQQVGVQLSDEISKEDTFSIQTFVSLATDDQLNDAGSGYPTWVTDRYLQLPNSLPEEVGLLASQIVRDAGAETPFEKAEAIKSFLKRQEYSLEIQGPEFGVDGIFYFLFQTQDEPCSSVDPDCDTAKIKGYSQYFGSSGAVLLRSVGVPARFVAGWGSGEYVPEAGLFLIRDEDRHGWTQVYFPEYGWIDYEMTPGGQTIERGRLAPSITGGDPFAAGAIGSAEDDPNFIQDIADLERLARESREADGEFPETDDGAAADEFEFPWRPFAWFGGLVGVVVALMGIWKLSLRGMDAPTRAYARMNRVASVMGIKRQANETALEFAQILGERAVAASDPANFIALEFQRQVYAGAADSSDAEGERSKELDRAWRKVARALIAYRIRQIGGIGPELGEGRGT
jgi:transglutaminase-like putative cysteine protease